jgi:hypothetical protein
MVHVVVLSSVSYPSFRSSGQSSFRSFQPKPLVPVRHQRAEGRSGVIILEQHLLVNLLRIRVVSLARSVALYG